MVFQRCDSAVRPLDNGHIGSLDSSADRHEGSMMKTTGKHRTTIISVLAAALLGAATSLMLFVGAGTAQADPQEIDWAPYVPMSYLTVRVTDTTGVASDCFYTSTPMPWSLWQLPTYQHQFHLPANQQVSWQITNYDWPLPPVATGTFWNVTVDCGANGQSTKIKQF
jgi:hypothetical protein